MTEVEYLAAYPTLAERVTYAQWCGDESCGETHDVIEGGAIKSSEPMRLWYSNGCRILTDLSDRPWCVPPCAINANYYVSCVYGEWAIHYFAAGAGKSWDSRITDLVDGEDWRTINDWIDRVFKVREGDARIIRIIKASVIEALENVKRKEAAA
ncbi:hypothetical protein RJP21_04835 [Paenibacillus sp. VCA1]|uniref:hypothetical protein n=1 Tax=Paenibacillus sp. VCA1 TaxID=3039148 RepID=UPI0028720D03|nr:hypothetical protein [Paenibacillus sp. VCA1]MDR9852926.1 hypothetical protein [Paenibacillus sp. VCA1]